MKKENFMDYELSSVPNNNYKKMFDKFKKIEHLPVSEWKKIEILGYFCKKYFDFYQSNYVFKFNTPTPSKCFEVWQVSALSGKLSSDPQILKTYIDWSFKEVVPKAKRKLTSISFLNKDDVLTFYKMNVLQNSQENGVNRSTFLPDYIKSVFKNVGITINNYGELSFLYKMDNPPPHVMESISKIESLGFDNKIVDKIL